MESKDLQDAKARDVLTERIGNAARSGRAALGLTQEAVARLVGLKNAESYARIERGHALPSVETFARLASVLRLSADDMLGVGPHREPLFAEEPQERTDVARLIRRLRTLTHSQLRLVAMVIKEMEGKKRF